MSFKIPCGGFRLDEKLFSLDKDDVLSIPKPLTYDYMPEGYPKKVIDTVTLMEEQEVAFFESGSMHLANLEDGFKVDEGQTYIVNWDGTEYECVCFYFNSYHSYHAIGNLSIGGMGDDTGEPFIYTYNLDNGHKQFVTLDTSASHTISVKTTAETVTPMAEEFLPSMVNELIMNSSTPDSTKKFKITVDDSGTIKATEVT